MADTFWIFLSVAVFMGILLPIVAIVTKHKQTMMKLEIEALKTRKTNSLSENKDAAK